MTPSTTPVATRGNPDSTEPPRCNNHNNDTDTSHVKHYDISDSGPSDLKGFGPPPTDPDLSDMLTLPPHCNYWLQEEFDRQVRQLEEDVQALLIDDSMAIKEQDDNANITSAPREHWNRHTTPLFDSSENSDRHVTTWSRDDIDLSTYEGTEYALQELEWRPPTHLSEYSSMWT